MHYRNFELGMPSCKGGATVAIHPIGNTDQVMVAVARCNKTDIFNKKLGRTIALGRINKALSGKEVPGVFTVVVKDGETYKSAVNAVLAADMEDTGLM